MPGPVNFPMQPMEATNWCWAAVSVSVNDFLPNPTQQGMTQCQLATMVLQITGGCCGSPPPMACNQKAILQTGLAKLDRFPGLTQSPRTFDFVKSQIDQGRILVIQIAWKSGSTHFAVIYDYLEVSPTERYVFVNSPSVLGSSFRSVSYDGFISTTAYAFPGRGRWLATYPVYPATT